MDYEVPQFIDVEDKIFGPLTLKQFIYLGGGVGLCAILILSLPLIIGIFLSIPVAGFAGALAFYKVNGKPFIEILESGFMYYLNRRLYLWRKEKKATPVAGVAPDAVATPVIAKKNLSQRKLEDLAWELDVKNTGAQEPL